MRPYKNELRRCPVCTSMYMCKQIRIEIEIWMYVSVCVCVDLCL